MEVLEMATWHCMQRCGACCYLAPAERPDLEDYLTPAQLSEYYSLVGVDGWCVHFQDATRTCAIYDQRPDFCRVEPATFEAMYGVPPAELDEFALACCVEHIGSVYGPDSPELARYQTETGFTPAPPT